MKISYLSSSIIPSTYANSVQVMKMCEAFSKNGNSVMLYARENLQSNYSENEIFDHYSVNQYFELDYSRWPKIPFFGGLYYKLQVQNKLNKNKTDIYYGRDRYSISCLAKTGKPFIYESHEPPRNLIHNYYEKKILSSDNLVKLVVTANSIRSIYLKKYPWFDDSKIEVHPNGSTPVLSKNDINFDTYSGVQNVGYVGSLGKGKGIDIILKIAEIMPEKNFHIVGGKIDAMNVWQNKCKSGNVKFHGFVNQKSLSDFYKKFDVLLSPYHNLINDKTGVPLYPSPLKNIEYMSAGKPIVASDILANREVFSNDENAILCDPEKIDEWVNAIRLIDNNEKLAIKLIRNSTNEYYSKYTWVNRAKRVLE